jgi:O-antigen/teichoic acid export membrane protein
MNLRTLFEYYAARKEHIINFSSFFINRIFSLALFACTTSIFINRAGNELYGTLTMLLLIFNYISIADLGMGYAVGYRLTRAVSRRNYSYSTKILQHAIPFYICVALLSCLVVFAFSTELSKFFTKTEEYSFVYKVISLSIFPLILDSIVLMIMQSFNKIYLVNISRLIYDIFRAVPLLLVLIVKKELLETIITIIAIGCYIKLFIDIYICCRIMDSYSWLRPVFAYKELLFNIKYGIPMVLALIIWMVISSLDKFYITKFMSMEKLAYYSVALDVNVKAWFLIWAVTGSLQTVLIRRNVLNKNTYDIHKVSMIAVAAIFIFYYMPLILFSKQILALWINSDFAEKSYKITRILSFASLFYMIYAVKHIFLQAYGKFFTIVNIYSIGLLFLLISLCLLPKYFEVEGVALSYVITYAAFALTAIASMKKRFL